MNLTIDVSELQRARQGLAGFSSRRLDAALATALTRTALEVRRAQEREMRDVFDRPTKFTLNSLYLKPAQANNLQAEVGIKDDLSQRSPLKWLRWQVRGGQRTPKAFEKLLISAGAMPAGMVAVPGRFAKLDAFGNHSPGQLRQILSQLRIEPTQGATSALPTLGTRDQAALRDAAAKGARGPVNASAVKDARSKRNRINSAYRRAGGQFVAFPGGRGKLRPGIYQVRATAFGRTDPKPVIIFVARARYEAGRFDFDYVARLVADRSLANNINAALQEQIRRLAAKQATGGAA